MNADNTPYKRMQMLEDEAGSARYHMVTALDADGITQCARTQLQWDLYQSREVGFPLSRKAYKEMQRRQHQRPRGYQAR